MTPLLTVDDLAKLMHLSPATVTSRLSKHPQSLPPVLKIPGQKKPLWRPEAVSEWLDSLASPINRGRPRRAA